VRIGKSRSVFIAQAGGLNLLKEKRAKAFKNGKLTLGEIRKAVGADKKLGR